MIIKVENLHFAYKIPGAKPKPALKAINLEIQPAEVVGIIGLSGSGKSTLMHHFTGLLKPDSGRILVNSENIFEESCDLSKIRQKIGLVFQFPEKQLFKETVFDDISVGPINQGLAKNKIQERVHQAMHSVGLEVSKYETVSPLNLSHGEKRRVAIAGILTLHPDCLMLDEPTAGLDSSGVELIRSIIAKFYTAQKTVVVISHNMDFVLSVATRIIILHNGQTQFNGSPPDLMNSTLALSKIGFPELRIIKIIKSLKKTGYLKNEAGFSLEKIKEQIAI